MLQPVRKQWHPFSHLWMAGLGPLPLLWDGLVSPGWGSGSSTGDPAQGTGAIHLVETIGVDNLVADQAGIHAPPLQKLIVRALLDDHPVPHAYNLVGVADGAQPVRDHQRGPPFGDPLQCGLHQSLVFGIQRRGCLVQDQDLWVANRGARNGDPLLLTPGKRRPFAADVRVKPSPKLHDEVIAVGQACSILDLLLGDRAAGAIRDVLPNGGPKEVRALVDNRYLVAEGLGVQIAEVMAIQRHTPSLGIVEAH
mmetsp:Transcript_111984/g.194430  ORF Transcript_111984/g.194430 Transcript_111984/m.194430 type:complete len:252 (+) Transcript_111984:1161-1916(+)